MNPTTPWGSLGSSGFVHFTRVRPGGSWVHPGSLGLLEFALGVVGFTQGRSVHSGSPWGSLVHPGTLGSLGFALGAVGVVGLTQVRPGNLWVHPG